MALTVGIIIGFVVLGIVAVAVLIMFPYEQIFAPTPTVTATSTVTPTPTFPVFLPTASTITPTSQPPTPTNTRVPTTTPFPTATATETLPPRIFPTVAVPTLTPTRGFTETTPTATAPPRFYTISFEADDTTLSRGRCTTLRWQVSGPVTLWVEDQPVEKSGLRRICPRNDTTYTLEYRVAGSTQRQRETITIDVQ